MTTAHHLYTLKKIVFTLLAVLLSAFLFVILVTYTPNDPSWSRISSDMGEISNMGGAVGAWLSDLLYTFLGWATWWLMGFLIYEAICLWWQRNQAFGPLRAIAYVFLLLASCGLMAVIPQLLGFVSDNGARFGGILGVEVATRLSNLLTIYGAALFLLAFSLITATFAFDIHWKRVFKELFSLSWLGSGIRRSSADLDNQQASDPSIDGVEEALSAESGAEEIEHNGDSPLEKQLKLSLPDPAEDEIKHDQHAAQTVNAGGSDPALSNVLDDFLVNSGLTESILVLREQEAKAAAEEKQKQQSAQPSLQSEFSDEKQEPSFAWNDQDVINELLDAKAPYSAELKSDNETSAITEVEGEVDNFDNQPKNIDTSRQDSQPSKQAISSVSQPQQTESIFEPDTNDTDLEATEYQPSISVTESEETNDVELAYSEDRLTEEESENEEEPLSFASKVTSDTPVFDNPDEEEKEEQDNELDALLNTEVDLTPTNTPPSNPKKPHEPVESNTDSSNRVIPSIRFATPEGGASNHIEDMVPDSEDEPAEDVHLPEIHDDTAFASSSRAMQTAKYRESLSPIPELSILDKPDPDRKPSYTQAELKQLSELLEIKLQEFNVKAEVVNAIPGPVVTRFEVDLAAGVKASKVTGISRDLARSLSMASLRVVEVIPGKPYIGIEVPNKKREMVRLVELLQTEDYKNPKAQISMAMGKDIGGKPIITDLARAPHMLVAGTTGSGKSVLVNAMLLSMLLKYKPSELRLILIDPKQLELANYNDIPHLLTPVVTDMNEAASSLAWCVAEMERRYQLMSLLKVRKLSEFNKKVIAAEKAGRPMIDPLWRPNESVSLDKAPKLKTLPMIVIVADEFADMIMQVGKQAEELITRLAQKSRAAGIHLMLATQRPSVDVITGLIKANIPVRAALRVNSKVDSRTILDAGGAEDMLGNGDMLFLGPGQIEPDRVHGAYVSDEEVNRVCDAWRERGAPDYIDNMASNFDLTSPSSSGAGNTSGEDDALYDEAVAFVMETRKVSASSIQRKFSIGYNRAARIVDSMEEAGLVSSMGKSGKRELLM